MEFLIKIEEGLNSDEFYEELFWELDELSSELEYHARREGIEFDGLRKVAEDVDERRGRI